MSRITEFLFFLSFFVPALLSVLTYILSHRLKSKEFMHLTEFWASLAAMTVVSYIFRSSNQHIVAVSLLGWFWPLKTIMQLAKDMTGIDVFNRTKVIILAVGVFLTLILASYNFPFTIYTIAFCVSVGAIGALMIGEIYKKMEKGKISLLGHFSFFFLSLFFVVRVLYPLWGNSSFQVYGMVADLIVLIGLAATTVSFYMEVLKDLNEKQCQRVLKERSEQFLGQSKYSELGMMSAGIAHEINNPLAIIQAKTTQLLRILNKPDRIQEVADGLEQILYTSDRIHRTIQGVRDFVHQDERVPNEEFSVKILVDDVLAFCGQRMKNHGVNLRFYGMEDYILRGHKIQLEQVLLNLFNNSFDAIEFLPDKWIEMSVHETASTVQMYIKDSGTGIPPETASRMMEAFFTTKKIGKGTGLGLALARGIIEKHGGSLVYIGNAQHTTFMLELPKPDHFRPETIQKDYDQGQPILH